MKTLITLIFTLLISNTINAADFKQYDIRIDGITCPFCVASSETALKKIDGIHAISTNIDTGTMTVCTEPSLVLEEDHLKALFLKKGFTYRSLTESDVCSIDDTELDGDHSHE